ncbi:MAG: HTTM domain-containing protein [Fuerstiella sp.]
MDPFTLGMVRVLTGLMLTYNLLVWGLDLHAFFGPTGLQPLQAISQLHQGTLAFTFLEYVPADWLTVVHFSCVTIAALFCLGFCSRITSVLAFVITVSYSQRVPVANFGLDQILGLLCLYLAIGPSGAALSVDAWIRGWRARRRGRQLAPPKLASAQMTLRLIQIHVCVIYFWAGFAKLKGDSWWTGEAMWQVIANQEYQTRDLTWMAHVPWLPYLLAHVTVAWEVFFCILVWRPRLRPLMLLIGTAMHLGIGAFLGMWTFGLIMTFPYLAFSDSARWRRRLTAWPGVNSEHADNHAEPPIDDTEFIDEDHPLEGMAAPDHEVEATAAAPSAPDEPIRRIPDSEDDLPPAAPEPPVVIDYRRGPRTQQKPPNSPNSDDGDDKYFETRSIDDEYVLGTAEAAAVEMEDREETEHGLTEESMEQPDVGSAPAPGSDTGTQFKSHPATVGLTQDPAATDFPPDDPSAEKPDSDILTSGAAMTDNAENSNAENSNAESGNAENNDTKHEIAPSRMERLKPKSANSLTGAPPPRIDGRVEDSVLAPESEVLLIAIHAPERNTFRTYLRRHDIPCRAAISAENALSVVLNMKPAAVLLSGSCMNPEEIITLVDDLNDMVDAPILALLTMSQIKLLRNDPLSAHVLQYPASLRQIREELTTILMEEGNAKPRCSLRAAMTEE